MKVDGFAGSSWKEAGFTDGNSVLATPIMAMSRGQKFGWIMGTWRFHVGIRLKNL